MNSILPLSLFLLFPLFVLSGAPTILLVDDYYQKPRPGERFSQGVALEPELRPLSNFYSLDANGIPNGTFVLSEILKPRFQLETSREPISEQLLSASDAYMLICPVKEARGGRPPIGAREADLLEQWVADGGMLILVFNSIPSPEKSGFDFEAMNEIARRFGVTFDSEQTETILVPIPPENPFFFEADNIIYGNGTTIVVDESSSTDVVLRDFQDRPIATLTRHGDGKVLLFGDAGSFGNAHLLRTNVDQEAAVRELFFSLLPEGPLPGYRWSPGETFTIRVSDEQVLSGYPEVSKILGVPKHPGTRDIVAQPRQLDLESDPNQAPRKSSQRRYASYIHPRSEQLEIRVSEKGPALADPEKNLKWDWLIRLGVVCSGHRPYIKPGESWKATGKIPLPRADLGPIPVLRDCEATFYFKEAGEDTFTLTQHSRFTLQNADFLHLFPETRQGLTEGLTFLAGAVQLQGVFIIDAATRLPLRSEYVISASVWFGDDEYPPRYQGYHDWKTVENWEHVVFIPTFGRKIGIDFLRE